MTEVERRRIVRRLLCRAGSRQARGEASRALAGAHAVMTGFLLRDLGFRV